MRILPGHVSAPDDLRGGAIALGVMDGVHLGHQAVLADAREAAKRLGAPFAAVVFEPHPRNHFRPDAPPFRLQTPQQRARVLTALGADAVFQIPFNAEIASLGDEEFSRVILRDALGIKHVTVGFDFQYGQGRQGRIESLRDQGKQFGFSVGVVAPVERNGEKVSSTAIRERLSEGALDEATAMLTRPWAIEGEVVHGQQRGRTIDFPTANIALGAYQRPRFGVYAVRASVDGTSLNGVANIGVRPTVGTDAPLLEAHLFDFAGDLYGRTLEVEILSFIRPEQKFESFDALKAQIGADAAEARRRLA
ncbi:MAG: bifunctional riboflavin kinase/FAD synthetase [Hyphomonadaceae bacterium]